MEFRKIEIAEYKAIADLHLQGFTDFFLSSLGERFLRTYYKACLKSKESIAICAVNNDNQLLGFSIGCTHSNGYHKRLVKQNFLSFLLQGVAILFTKPMAIIRLLKNLDKSQNKTDDGNYAELLSIALSPELKGLGIGKEMIFNFEKEAINRSCRKIALTTDFNNNEQVLEFYRRNGYKVFYEFTSFHNRKMYKLIKELK